MTGAMRGPTMPGADGNANLLAAVTAVAAPGACGLGALVVLNDEIHCVRLVEKGHTGLPSAFSSPGFGPIGHVVEGEAFFSLRPLRSACPPLATLPEEVAPVAVIKVGLGDDARLIAAVSGLGYRGPVVEGMGAGHVSATMVEALEDVSRTLPTVLVTRVRAGPIFRKTYDFEGSETDLIRRGLIPAGLLTSQKALLF